jgi:tetratricopeptide (TPR) repeat protein
MGTMGRILHSQRNLLGAVGILNEALVLLRKFDDHQFAGFALGILGAVFHELGRLSDARASFEEALVLLRHAQNPCNLIAVGDFGRLCQEQRQYGEARALYQEVLAGIRQVGDRRGEAIYLAALASLDAVENNLAEAENGLARADKLAGQEPDLAVLATVRLSGAHLELAFCRNELGRGDIDQAIALYRKAHKHLDELSPSLSMSSDLRLAHRLLEQTLGSSRQPPLLISHECQWFVLPGTTKKISMEDRDAPRRILVALARLRITDPSVPLSLDALVNAGWPGEHLLPGAAKTRAYTAIATLRRRGLHKVVCRMGNGYLIDPTVPLVLASGSASKR